MWIIKKLANIALIVIVITLAHEHLMHSSKYVKYFIHFVDQIQYNYLNIKLVHFTEFQATFLCKLLAVEQGFIAFLIIFNQKSAYILFLLNVIAFAFLFYFQDILNFRMRYWTIYQRTEFFQLIAASGIALLLYGDKQINK